MVVICISLMANRSSDSTRDWPRLACECPGVSGGSVGRRWPAAGLGALSVAVSAWDLLKRSPLSSGFLGGSAGKESACNVGYLGSIPGLGRSHGEGKGYPLQYSGPGEFPGLCSPWGPKESDTTGRLSLHFTSIIFITPTIIWPQVKSRQGTQPCPISRRD